MPQLKPTPTLNLIGAGRLGQTLAHLWTRAGVLVVQDVLTTRTESAQAACRFIGAGTAAQSLAHMRDADVWLIATPDAQIAACATALAAARAATADGPRTVFHCSGALASDVLQALGDKGWQLASAHPILSFANAQSASAQFAGTPCALEGDAPACALLQTVFGAIGGQCFALRSEDKLLYHAAAVFATNFLPVLQSVAEAAWRDSGVPPELVLQLRSALLQNAVHNILAQGPAGALTGPAKRGDRAAIARQAAAVHAWDSQAGDAYAALSALALRLAGH